MYGLRVDATDAHDTYTRMFGIKYIHDAFDLIEPPGARACGAEVARRPVASAERPRTVTETTRTV